MAGRECQDAIRACCVGLRHWLNDANLFGPDVFQVSIAVNVPSCFRFDVEAVTYSKLVDVAERSAIRCPVAGNREVTNLAQFIGLGIVPQSCASNVEDLFGIDTVRNCPLESFSKTRDNQSCKTGIEGR